LLFTVVVNACCCVVVVAVAVVVVVVIIVVAVGIVIATHDPTPVPVSTDVYRTQHEHPCHSQPVPSSHYPTSSSRSPSVDRWGLIHHELTVPL